MNRFLLVGFSALLLILTACAGNSEESDPAAAVEAFWNAKIAGDADALRGVMCSAMEADVEMQAISYASVDAEIQDMACEADGENGDFTIVTCEGKIIALYGTETREFPLGTSQLVQEDGAWKWCGESAPAGN